MNGIENIPTIKNYLKKNFWSNICTSIKKNALTKHNIKDPIMLYFSIFPGKEQLLGVKKYFNQHLVATCGSLQRAAKSGHGRTPCFEES